jgi:hypothetical protein
MGVLETVGRVGLGIATGGASELAIAGYNALKPDDVAAPNALRSGAVQYGGGAQMIPNPDYAAWKARMDPLTAQWQATTDPAARAQIKAQIDAVGAAPPETIPNPLMQASQTAQQQGTTAAGNISTANAALQNTGAAANAQGQAVNTGYSLTAPGSQPNLSGQTRGTGFGSVPSSAFVGATGSASNTALGNRTVTAGPPPTVTDQYANRAAPQMAENGVAAAQQQAAIAGLEGFRPSTAGQDALLGFQPNSAAAAPLRSFAANQAGVDALNRFASGPTGPSAAEAMLRLQSARDKAAALSRARSARGGAGAVNEALKVAQAEGSAISADTRGQLSLVQAQEAAMRRQETLQATTSAAQLIGQQDQTQVQALSAAGNIDAQADQTRVSALSAGTQAGLQGSAQELQAKTSIIEATSRVRDQDITVLRDNLSAELQTIGLNDNQVRFFTGLGEAARQAGIQAQLTAQAQGIDATVAAEQAQMAYTELAWRMLSADQQAQLQAAGIEAGVDMTNAQQRSAFTGQVLGFLGTGMTAIGTAKSDRRAKIDVKKIRDMSAAIRGTPGHTWRYKKETDGEGRFAGAMAQDLEKFPEWRSAVKKGPDGQKMVDGTRLVMSHHAAIHHLQTQIDRLGKLRPKKAS